jgi:hypothetical protein
MELMNQPPYRPNLAPSDFYCLRSDSKSNNELKRGVLNWLQSPDKSFYDADIIKLPG